MATDKTENAKSDAKPADKKEEKTKAKEKVEDENSEQEDEKSEEDGEDKEVPLLDQPLEKSGKRERKNVQRFNEEFPSETKEV